MIMNFRIHFPRPHRVLLFCHCFENSLPCLTSWHTEYVQSFFPKYYFPLRWITEKKINETFIIINTLFHSPVRQRSQQNSDNKIKINNLNSYLLWSFQNSKLCSAWEWLVHLPIQIKRDWITFRHILEASK